MIAYPVGEGLGTGFRLQATSSEKRNLHLILSRIVEISL